MSELVTKFQFRFIDLHHQLGVAYKLKDGNWKSFRVAIPEEYVEDLQDVHHGRI